MKKIDLINFISGNTSKQENTKILQWLGTSPKNRGYFNSLKDIWVLSTLPEERADELDYVNFKLKFPIQKERKIKAYYIYFTAIAASIILFLFIAKPYFNSQIDIIESNPTLISNNTTDIYYYNLPDSTRIALYPKSEINYSKDYFLHNRAIILKGKAFFEVISDAAKSPFHIYTKDNIDIMVTGTKFFVNSSVQNSNSTNNKFEAFLKEGRISIKQRESNTEIHMIPGDMVFAKKNMKISKISNTTHPKEMDFLYSYFCFENATMSDVLYKLENYYNISFICKRNEIPNLLFTGDINGETLDTILTLFNRSMEIQSIVDNRIITLY